MADTVSSDESHNNEANPVKDEVDLNLHVQINRKNMKGVSKARIREICAWIKTAGHLKHTGSLDHDNESDMRAAVLRYMQLMRGRLRKRQWYANVSLEKRKVHAAKCRERNRQKQTQKRRGQVSEQFAPCNGDASPKQKGDGYKTGRYESTGKRVESVVRCGRQKATPCGTKSLKNVQLADSSDDYDKKLKNVVAEVGDLVCRMKHRTVSKLHRCEICGLEIGRINVLRRHMESHRDDDAMTSLPQSSGRAVSRCEECGREFASLNILRQHRRTHSREKPHMCSVCGVSFSHSGTLNRHMLTHTGELPFRCTECGRRFRQVSNLTHHMMSHSGEKPHKCRICDKGFRLASKLNVHLRSHTGEQPHKCKTCGKGFDQMGNLNKHIQIHLDNKPHLCPECGRAFCQRSNLQKHIKKCTAAKSKLSVTPSVASCAESLPLLQTPRN